MKRKGSLLRELPILVILALLVSLLIKSFLVQFFYIPSGSMENTLQIRDRVAVNRVPFIGNDVSRGDVIVFRDPAGWLPEASSVSGNRVTNAIREGLVIVGVIPNPAKQYLVKRVIGVAGDRIVCCTDKKLTINGTPVDEPYIFKGNNPSEMTFDITVDPGKIWVMGDHRGASADSRYHQDDINKGQVPLSRVTGRVFGVIWPFGNAKIVPSVPVLK
jgi:signal peptidase I